MCCPSLKDGVWLNLHNIHSTRKLLVKNGFNSIHKYIIISVKRLSIIMRDVDKESKYGFGSLNHIQNLLCNIQRD